MFFHNWFFLSTAIGASATALTSRAPTPWSNYNNNGVFYPSREAESWRTLYARTLQLADKSILLSWEDYDPTAKLTYWPIYRSTDGGVSFSNYSRVEDQVNGWGNWYQPFLYELPQAFGGFPKGTILIAGASTPRDLSHAYIDLYASPDQGKTWKFLSHIVYGDGPETIRNGDKAVWEPFLMMYGGKLVCYYSTQADPKYAQKLAHKVTGDLYNWGPEVNDVAEPNYYARPGMATVAKSTKTNKFVMTFEYCGNANIGGCPVHYKVANNPLEFNRVQPKLITPYDWNLNPNGSPYVIWTPTGTDGSGVFIMSGDGKESVYINTDAVDPNGWKPVNVNQWSAYSRSLRIVNTPVDSAAKGARKLLIANGGNIGCSGDCYNYVATGLVDIPSY